MTGERRMVGVDLGGTNLRAAVICSSGAIEQRQSVPTNADDGPDTVLQRMATLVESVAGAAALDTSAVIGVAAPGPLNPKTGVVHFTPNLPGWRDFPLRDELARLTGMHVVVENDANCAVVGEARFGAAKGAQDVIYLGLGTGVGGGAIANGKLVSGVNGLGGELGHVCVAVDGPRCTCGGIGCLEAFTAGWAIAREGELVAATSDGESLRLAAGGNGVTPRTVINAADAGDAAARAILERAGRALGAALGAFVNIFNPELIVIGGGLGVGDSHIISAARSSLIDYSFRAQRLAARIVIAELGDDSGLFGAGAMALDADPDLNR
ncbi:MAG: ROK family protein [Thermomicrobiales bacterium]